MVVVETGIGMGLKWIRPQSLIGKTGRGMTENEDKMWRDERTLSIEVSVCGDRLKDIFLGALFKTW